MTVNGQTLAAANSGGSWSLAAGTIAPVRVEGTFDVAIAVHVFHLVSTVEGRLREDIDHVAALRSCFPGGSITGAPGRNAASVLLTDLGHDPAEVMSGPARAHA